MVGRLESQAAGELIADFEAQAAGLRVAQMMRLSRGAAGRADPSQSGDALFERMRLCSLSVNRLLASLLRPLVA
jgi:hypothetical protein